MVEPVGRLEMQQMLVLDRMAGEVSCVPTVTHRIALVLVLMIETKKMAHWQADTSSAS